jgi:hypothetical protein
MNELSGLVFTENASEISNNKPSLQKSSTPISAMDFVKSKSQTNTTAIASPKQLPVSKPTKTNNAFEDLVSFGKPVSKTPTLNQQTIAHSQALSMEKKGSQTCLNTQANLQFNHSYPLNCGNLGNFIYFIHKFIILKLYI